MDFFFCKVPRPHFLGRPLIWPGYFGEHILGLFGLDPSTLSKSEGFVFLSGKAHWFLYLLRFHYYTPGMFIFCGSSKKDTVVGFASRCLRLSRRFVNIMMTI